MNILIDFHAMGFKGAFYKLFNDRLKWNVYIPTGKEWFNEGYWYLFKHFNYNDMSNLANQFLLEANAPSFLKKECPHINFIKLNDVKNKIVKFDVMIASVPSNYPRFLKLISDYELGSKLIFHAGNNFHHDDNDIQNVKNLLTSAQGPFKLYNASNKVFYHHEMDTSLFSKKIKYNVKSVINLQHCMDDFKTFAELEKLLPEWDFKAYGSNNRDFKIPLSMEDIAEKIKNCGFLYHVKKIDEGFGMMIHCAFACGTPVITDKSYMTVYYDKNISNTASLMFSNDTIIDINNKSISEIVFELKKMSDNYEYHIEKVYDMFKNKIDFDTEQKYIEKFLENLI